MSRIVATNVGVRPSGRTACIVRRPLFRRISPGKSSKKHCLDLKFQQGAKLVRKTQLIWICQPARLVGQGQISLKVFLLPHLTFKFWQPLTVRCRSLTKLML